VHLQNAGHSLVCDPLYGSPDPILLSSFKKKFNLSKADEEERPLMSRLALHAISVNLTNQSGDPLEIEAPISRDLDATLKQLRKWGS
jgi:23S rRNA pseudouridine955/2504/2580 synthase/23S rRNA pseudouridine1911/1915/1917 synthase